MCDYALIATWLDVSRLANKAQIRCEWVLKGSFKKGLFITKSQNERKHQSYNQLAETLIFRVFASEVYAVCKYAKDKTYFVRFFQNFLTMAINTLGHIRSSGSTPKAIKTHAPYHSSQDSGENMANFHPRIGWQMVGRWFYFGKNRKNEPQSQIKYLYLQKGHKEYGHDKVLAMQQHVQTTTQRWQHRRGAPFAIRHDPIVS